jgi:hypothetical protein
MTLATGLKPWSKPYNAGGSGAPRLTVDTLADNDRHRAPAAPSGRNFLQADP